MGPVEVYLTYEGNQCTMSQPPRVTRAYNCDDCVALRIHLSAISRVDAGRGRKEVR